MRLPNTPRYRHSDENVLPLINIVFLLLIFFMVAGILARPDPFKVLAAESDAREQTSPRGQVLLLGKNGQWALGDQVLTTAEVPAAVQAYLQEHQLTALQLKADSDADSAMLALMLPKLRSAGAQRLQLLTLHAAP